MNSYQRHRQLGYNAAVEAICNASSLAPVLNAAWKDKNGARMAGILSAFAQVLDLCTRAKINFIPPEGADRKAVGIINGAPELRLMLLNDLHADLHPPAAKIPPGSPDPDLERAQSAAHTLDYITESIAAAAAQDEIRAVFAQHLKFSREAPSAASKTEEAKSPLQVEIVGMPERITTTSVARDGQGDIAETRQVEKDAT